MSIFDFLLCGPPIILDQWLGEHTGLFVSTVSPGDGIKPYETAIQHPRYRSGRVLVVEAYDTEEEARAGHNRWVAHIQADTLPDVLVDVCNCDLAVQGREVGMKITWARDEPYTD